jgi:hypothetical protein
MGIPYESVTLACWRSQSCNTRQKVNTDPQESRMVSCDAQTFSGITHEHFACILHTAQSSGINISGNSGTASRSGITLAWDYDPAAKELTVQCTDKPVFVGCGVILSQIRELVTNYTAA